MIKIQHKPGMEWRLRDTLKAFKVDKVYTTTEDRTLAIEELPKDVSIEEMKNWTSVDKVVGDKPKAFSMHHLAKLMEDHNTKKGHKAEHHYSTIMFRKGVTEPCRIRKRDDDGNIEILRDNGQSYSITIISKYVKDHSKDSMLIVDKRGEPLKDMKITEDGKILFTF